MAVGIIIGGAFTAIVNSLVEDIIMPLVGLIIGGINFTGISITLGEATIMLGNFIQAIIVFLLTALVLFIIIKQFNRFKKPEEPAPVAEPSDEVKLLTEIRDSLQK